MAVVINKEKLNNTIIKKTKQEKKTTNQQKPAKKHDGTYSYRPFALFFGKNTEDETEKQPVDNK